MIVIAKMTLLALFAGPVALSAERFPVSQTSICGRSFFAQKAITRALVKPCQTIEPKDLLQIKKLSFPISAIPSLKISDLDGLIFLGTVEFIAPEDRRFEILQMKLPPSVMELQITVPYNSKVTITKNSLKELSFLKKLKLEGVSEIEDQAFASQSNLSELWLINHHLRSLSSGTFLGLKFLESLFLLGGIDGYPVKTGISFDQLDPDVFSPLTHLKKLHIKNSSGQMTRIPLLQSLHQLETLSIDNTGVEDSVSKEFSLKNLEATDFEGLESLNALSISGNTGLKNLKNRSFSNLPHLRTLNLSHNGIETIEIGTFSGLLRLKRLNLKFNLIKEISPLAFDGLGHLFERQTALELCENPLLDDAVARVRLFKAFPKDRVDLRTIGSQDGCYRFSPFEDDWND